MWWGIAEEMRQECGVVFITAEKAKAVWKKSERTLCMARACANQTTKHVTRAENAGIPTRIRTLYAAHAK